MTQNSFPKAAVSEKPLGDHEWKQLFLPMGRGVIDRGGHPYKVVSRDSVTDTVTIGVDSRTGYNSALLDGFVHYMDAPEALSVPPVATETVYEIGLVYDPTQHAAEAGPIRLDVWTAPADYQEEKSRLILYRITRKPNVSLATSALSEERPRAIAWIGVSKESDLPTSGLVLYDTLALVGTTKEFHRSRIDEAGVITWERVGAEVDATWAALPNTVVARGEDGTFLIADPGANPANPATKRYVDSKTYPWSSITSRPSSYPPSSHTHTGSDITSRVPFEHVDGSSEAYSNTNLGSTWTSVAVNSQGFLGRYPSALKYKKNIRSWNPDPRTILDMEPVQYDVRPETAGSSEDSDKGLIGFVADSYVETRRELVLIQDGEVEGFHYHLMPVAQQVVLRYLDRERRRQAEEIELLRAENARLAFNQAAIIAHLGLSTDADGRVITTGSEA